MTCNELIKYIEDWAPKEIAWQKDNVGLQIGSKDRKIKNILLSLDLSQKVVDEASNNQCNLIITHHPLLFHPLKKIDTSDNKIASLIEAIIKKNITLYSAHTNLDYTKDGVSFQLAKALQLKQINFLVNLEKNQYKVVVFVPPDHLEKLSEAIFKSGGGIIGNYNECSFRLKGEGTFKGSENTNPVIGTKNIYEKVEEVRVEYIVNSWKLNEVIRAIYKNHPYEEPAFDIYPLNNKNINYGIGAIGELEDSISANEFFNYISKNLSLKNFRFSNGKKGKIKTVAVCGGSGIEYLNSAIESGADAYITADIKYHSFQDAEDKILLIDAGHYETEIHSLNEIKRRLEIFLKKKNEIKVYKYSKSTNPISFYNN